MPGPAATALAILELLGAILFQLPPRDLLLAQQVNKVFHDAIQASKRIQRKLFFISSPVTNREPALLNPFIGRIARLCSGDPYVFYNRQYWFEDEPSRDNREEEYVTSAIGDIREAPFEVLDNENIDITFEPSRENRLANSEIIENASFRKMLIANGPCKIWIGPACCPPSLPSDHMHWHEVTTTSMAELADMFDIDWVESMCESGGFKDW